MRYSVRRLELTSAAAKAVLVNHGLGDRVEVFGYALLDGRRAYISAANGIRGRSAPPPSSGVEDEHLDKIIAMYISGDPTLLYLVPAYASYRALNDVRDACFNGG